MIESFSPKSLIIHSSIVQSKANPCIMSLVSLLSPVVNPHKTEASPKFMRFLTMRYSVFFKHMLCIIDTWSI